MYGTHNHMYNNNTAAIAGHNKYILCVYVTHILRIPHSQEFMGTSPWDWKIFLRFFDDEKLIMIKNRWISIFLIWQINNLNQASDWIVNKWYNGMINNNCCETYMTKNTWKLTNNFFSSLYFTIFFCLLQLFYTNIQTNRSMYYFLFSVFFTIFGSFDKISTQLIANG